jgi:hypothetical protein
MEKVQRAMFKAGIRFAPVKGGYLIDHLYKNRAVRTTNDIDALIKRSTVSKVDVIMKEMGYCCGDIDLLTREVSVPDKSKRMLYKTKMYNLLPYVKFGSNIPNNAVIFDLSFALDFTLNTAIVDEMIDLADIMDGKIWLKPEHYFIHLCCHHYREASHTEWIRIGKDLTLMKFCDTREFIRNKMNSKNLDNALRFTKQYNCQKAVYFTVYFLREIYDDGYENEILSSLNINDDSYLYEFGENEFETTKRRKKDFWTSLFSDTNEDEITESPKYDSLL